MWALFEALRHCNQLNAKLIPTQHSIALAGGVLNVGKSDKDLDLVLYPHNDITADYVPALQMIREHFDAEMRIFNFEMENHKLVFELKTSDGRRIDVFIPNKTRAQRTEQTPNVHGGQSYA